MRAVLDACVLYPTILREILIGCARERLYEPLWSDRILEEWTRATHKLGPEAPVIAKGEAALIRAAFPRATIKAQTGLEARLLLPDANDVHVLACAIAGHADAIITVNASDFPQHVLREEGITRRDPDGFLWELYSHHSAEVSGVVRRVHATACQLSGEDIPLKSLMKKARLNRLAKAVLAEG